MNRFKKFIQTIRRPFDEWNEIRKIEKLTNAIWEYALKDSLNPVYTKKDAEILSIAIYWNDADDVLKVLSYTDESGNRVFPRWKGYSIQKGNKYE